MEIKTLSGRQLVSTLLAAEAHLHLPLPPLLLVALYGRLPSFVGKKFFFDASPKRPQPQWLIGAFHYHQDNPPYVEEIVQCSS